MFEFANDGAYHWWRLFLIFSFEKSYPFLAKMRFPAQIDKEVIQMLSRKYVEAFDPLLMDFFTGEPGEQTREIFDRIEIEFEQQFGKSLSTVLIYWGNERNHGSWGDINYTMFRISGDVFFPLIAKRNEKHTLVYQQMKAALPQKLEKIKRVLRKDSRESRKLYDMKYEAKTAPMDEWEARANTLFDNRRVWAGSVYGTVFDELKVMLHQNREVDRFREIIYLLSDEEIATLAAVIDDLLAGFDREKPYLEEGGPFYKPLPFQALVGAIV
jgi:hypothetical protein